MSPIPNNLSSNQPQASEQDREAWLREQLAELKRRWPPHSVPSWMLERLDDLEEELQNELIKKGNSNIKM